MPYAIELFLDETNARLVEDVWSKMAEREIGVDLQGRAHITLGVWDDIDLDVAHPWLETFAAATPPLAVRFAGIGSFLGPQLVVFLAPVVNAELIEFHTRFMNVFPRTRGEAWSYSQPGSWVPHCTLALGFTDDQFTPVIEVARTIELPLSATLESIGIVEFPEILDHGTFALAGATTRTVQFVPRTDLRSRKTDQDPDLP
jgi:2'-5' RNA ligase